MTPSLLTIAHGLAAALKRVEPYYNLLPPTAAAEVREALEAWDRLVADLAIIQTPTGAADLVRASVKEAEKESK